MREYAAYVKQFDLERVARITGLNLADIMEATRLFATNGPACCNFSASTLTQQYNGFQTHRAILCLLGLTGNIDRPGGNIPSSNTYLCRPAGFKSRKSQYYMEKAPGRTMPTLMIYTMGDMLDWEDCSGTGHSSAGVIPTAVIAAEVLKKSGKDLFTAVVAEYEVYQRVALAGDTNIVGFNIFACLF